MFYYHYHNQTLQHHEIEDGIDTIRFGTGEHTVLIVIDHDCSRDIQFKTDGPDCHIQVAVLVIAKQDRVLSSTINGVLAHDHSSINIHMVTMLLAGADAKMHGGVIINPGVAKVEWRLLEENIILDKKVKIHTLPFLDVRSNDVAASHGARVETLDPKKLFYLQSKGIPLTLARQLMIAWYVQAMFALLHPGDTVASDIVLEHQQEIIDEIIE